jgi:type IV pilus modification protein PilV
LRAKGRKQAGFTLIEVLVALAVLGIVILPVLGLFTAASHSNHKSKRSTIALTLAMDIMDRIKAGDINYANGEREIKNYRDRYGVEIYISGMSTSKGGALKMVKVYVAPQLGMDPETEGIMLASYAANASIEEVDTALICQSVPSGEDGPPGLGEQ